MVDDKSVLLLLLLMSVAVALAVMVLEELALPKASEE